MPRQGDSDDYKRIKTGKKERERMDHFHNVSADEVMAVYEEDDDSNVDYHDIWDEDESETFI